MTPQGFAEGDTIELEMSHETRRVILTTADSAAYANGMATCERWRDRIRRVPGEEIEAPT